MIFWGVPLRWFILVGGVLAPLLTLGASLTPGIGPDVGLRGGWTKSTELGFSNSRPDAAPILPPTLGNPDPPHLADAQKVLLLSVTFEGNHVFSDEQLLAVIGSDLGRAVTAEELQAIRHRLTKFYVDHGYINSGTWIPDQEITNGKVHFQVVEGQVCGIQVSGNRRLHNSFIEQGLLPEPTEVLNMQQLQDRVLLLHQDPLIERIKVEVIPGLRRGEATLAAEVTEATLWHWQIETNNYRPPDVGSEQVILTGGFANITGNADALQVSYARSQGVNDTTIDYDFPLRGRNTALAFGGEYVDARAISPDFKDLDITGKSRRFHVGLYHFLVRSPDAENKLGVKLEWAENKTSLLDDPFSFFAGEANGKSSVAVIRLEQEWLSRSLEQVLAARSTFSLGIDALGSTINSSAPDSRFFSWMGELQWARRFGENRRYQQITRALARFSDESLLLLERFSMAGPNMVRGYREGLLIHDNGWLLSLELRAPLGDGEHGGQTLQIAPFIDLGQTWDKTEKHESLASAGIGLRWQPNERLQANIYFGVPFGQVDHPTTTLQDHGVLFQASYQF
ncbi:putative POTRA domain-containing protein [Gammaproteobacteria bacterium]